MLVFVAGLILSVLCIPTSGKSTLDLDEATILALIARVQNLENNDELQKKQIETLTENDRNQKNEIASLKDTISSLQEQIGDFKSKQDDERALANNAENDKDDEGQMPRTLPRSSKRDAVAAPRTSRYVDNEVAFYATNSAHDIQHLGHNQAIVFDVIHANVGNGYNNVSGHFTAPVPGVYVFHVTICGRDVHSEIDSHYYAYMAVNSEVKSSFIVTPYDQSSQMLVTALKAGDVVVMKNSRVDDGYIGQMFSSYSGFLLYETEGVSIVG